MLERVYLVVTIILIANIHEITFSNKIILHGIYTNEATASVALNWQV